MTMINEIAKVNIEGKIIDCVKFAAGEFEEPVFIVNLTPHTLNISTKEVLVDSWLRPDGPDEVIRPTLISVPPSGIVSRVNEKSGSSKWWLSQAISVNKITFSEIENLPVAKENVIYVVSRIVAQRVSKRHDVLCPGELLRDNQGNIIGCKGLAHF